MSPKRLTLDQSFERAYRAAGKNGSGEEPSRSRAVRNQFAQDAKTRRFVGDCQIDVKFKRLGTDPNGAVRPWYIVILSFEKMKMRHKFSIGGSADWQKHETPLADLLVEGVCREAIQMALDTQDDNIPDHVTECVSIATKGALTKGVYTVRKSR